MNVSNRPITLLLLVVGCSIFAGPDLTSTASGQTRVHLNKQQITTSVGFEGFPRLGDDTFSEIVVYQANEVMPNGSFGLGEIWYQRLGDDSLVGPPVKVRSPQEAGGDWYPDIDGQYIVFTAYEERGSAAGKIMIYDIWSGRLWPIGEADLVSGARIHDGFVAWREGTSDWIFRVMLYDLSWLGTGSEAVCIAGPSNARISDVNVGSRNIVWSQYENGLCDVMAFSLDDLVTTQLTNADSVDEQGATTSGPWITWDAGNHGVYNHRIEAFNVDTGEYRTIAEGEGSHGWPEIDGDFVIFLSVHEEFPEAPLDHHIHLLSTGNTYQIELSTDKHAYEYHLLGHRVTWDQTDFGTLEYDVWVATWSFVPPGVDEDVTEIKDVILSLDPAALKNPNMGNALLNKLDEVFALIEAADYAGALDKLNNDILRKTDGCATSGVPDRNDWITNCADQAELYALIQDLIAQLSAM